MNKKKFTLSSFSFSIVLHIIASLSPILLSSCSYSSINAKPPAETFFHPYYDITSLPVTDAFQAPKNTGSVEDFALEEISGIAQSHAVPDALWAEEDSGNENKIYLIGLSGKTMATFRMTSVDDRDWEDMSISTGPVQGIHYIYLAEIGDNNHVYPTKYIYRFPEPSFGNRTFPFSDQVNSVEKISFQYPDGIKNAEAIMIDPASNDIYIISKEGQAVVYVAHYPQPLDKTFTITKLGTLPISDVTGADISPDGKEIVIKNYSTVLYWKKSGIESVGELLQQTPQRAPYTPEMKGESICWSIDGSGYFVTSEGTGQPIYFYKRK